MDGGFNNLAVMGELFLGSWGAVTQGTSTETGVTLSTKRGAITTFACDAAAGAEDGPFTVTNTTVRAQSVVIVSIASTASAGSPMAWVSAVAAGSFAVTITNLHAANALDAAIVINFVVI